MALESNVARQVDEVRRQMAKLQAARSTTPASAAARASAADWNSSGLSLNPIWMPRRGLAFAGGFPKDTIRKNIVRVVRMTLKSNPNVRSLWSPDRKWSNCRVQLTRVEAWQAFIDEYRTRPNHRCRVGSTTCELRFSKEENIGHLSTWAH